MNRANYFNYIDEKLTVLAYRVEQRGKLNLLELNMHCENFYLYFFNKLFSWQLININKIKQNTEAIDLIDHQNRLLIQVSAINTKDKVESALAKDLSSYTGYSFKFISISKNADNLRKMDFQNPHNLFFNPLDDIYDINLIIKIIYGLEIEHFKQIYEFIKNELGSEVIPQNIETNLATIINILAKEDWNQSETKNENNPYEIDRKIEWNNLNISKNVIEEYKIHHSRLDDIYSEFDKQGVNKSKSVLDSIQRDYINNKNQLCDDDLFFKIISCVIDRIQSSKNYVTIPFDELELSVNILVVDAFIRCKIFENPEGYNLVTSR